MTVGLDRRAVVAELLEDRRDLLVVAGLGAPCWDVTAAGDHELNFPLWGAMGGAAMIGLGLALTRPGHRVVVVTGDGEQLMGLTALSTIASAAPANLGIAILDNERYGETGMQISNTATGTDLAAVAVACGFAAATTAREPTDTPGAVALLRTIPGPNLVVFKVSADVPVQVVPPRDGPFLAQRFRTAVSALRADDADTR